MLGYLKTQEDLGKKRRQGVEGERQGEEEEADEEGGGGGAEKE